MILLAIDTAASLCAACVWDAERGERGERGRAVLDIGKGHAEHLMGTVEAALAAAGVAYADLDAIAVSVGPGSFTGVRVGVAAARGLALALKVPALGVTTLEAIAAEARDRQPGRAAIALVDAGRGQVYAAAFAPEGDAMSGPAVLGQDEAAALVAGLPAGTLLAGSAARALATAAGRATDVAGDGATADIAVYARLAAADIAAGAAASRPKPLYLRAADAKPQTAFALPRKPGA